MQRTVLVRYGEIHLKGLNRPFFEKILIRNIKKSISSFDGANVEKRDGRIYVEGYDEFDESRIITKVRKVFGVHSVSSVLAVSKDIETIVETSKKLVGGMLQDKDCSFKVRARRSDKRFEMSSMELAAFVGGELLTEFDLLKVDLHNPEIILDIEVREQAYIYTNAKRAVGGMPVGTAGRAMLLLSGGIDSPLAGYMIAKRGAVVECIHFESVPYTSEQARQKVIDLAKIMSEYCGPIRLHIVSFTDIQQKLYSDGPSAMLTILMRRYMMRISEYIAKDRKCKALITGENLGQVASQTMDSLNATNSVVDMPVYRPLIGFDKLEIIDRSKQIGTYETSILPYEDCCSVFVPKHPVTKPKLSEVAKAEEGLDMDDMVKAAIDNVEVIIIKPDVDEW